MLVIPRPRPQIDWGHPLTRGLLDIVIATPFGLRSLRAGVHGVSAGTALPVIASDAGGWHLRTSAPNNASYVTCASPALGGKIDATPCYTIWADCAVHASSSSPVNLSTARSVVKWATIAGEGLALSTANDSGGNIKVQAALGANRSSYPIALPAGRHGVFGVCHKDVGPIVYAPRLGLQSATWSGSWGMSSGTIEGSVFTSGTEFLTSSPGDKSFWVGGLWARELFADERLQIAYDWRVMLLPDRIVMPGAASAGYTHPTLSNARMIWTGQGAGKPAVDYTW